MQRVLVVGAGFMGSGIAQVCAQAGCLVHLMDEKQEVLDRAMKEIEWSVKKLVAKGFLPETPETICARIDPEQDLHRAAQSDWVIEAVPELEVLKLKIFKELDQLAPAGTPLCTNTSSIPITRIARATRKPERVLGLHFFGPVPLMGLVEVIKGDRTSDEVFEKGLGFVRSLGKKPVKVKKDVPLFVMNRIFTAAFREALDLVEKGVVTIEDVDLGMRLGYGWSTGPFEVADNAGLDIWAQVQRFMKIMGEEGLITKSTLLDEMVAQGRLGRKAGKGFYDYSPEGNRIPKSDEA